MKKDVYISIRGVQRADDGRDETELFTRGGFCRRNNSYYITYDESEATGFEGCKTTLKVEGSDKITLIRSGPVRSHLVVQSGERNIGRYGTEQGDIVIGVNTRQIDSHLTDEGGDLYFAYSLDINSSLVSENEVFINIKDFKKNGANDNGESNSGSERAVK